MAGPAAPREELDALLEALEAPAPAGGEARVEAAVGVASVRGGTPPGGHADFSDLFVSDRVAPPRGDLDEKLEWFRDRLRRAEAQLARVREAFGTRDAELAAAESELARERAAGQQARTQLTTLQRFLEHKKSELAAYGAKVKQALLDKDARIEALERELADRDAALAAERRAARKQRDWSDAAAVQAAATVAKLSEGLRAAVARWQVLAAELEEIDRALPPLRLGSSLEAGGAAAKTRRGR